MRSILLLFLLAVITSASASAHSSKSFRHRHKRLTKERFEGFRVAQERSAIESNADSLESRRHSPLIELQQHINLALIRYGKLGKDQLDRLVQERHHALRKRNLVARSSDEPLRISKRQSIASELSATTTQPLIAPMALAAANDVPTDLNAPAAFAAANGKVIQGNPNTQNTAGVSSWSAKANSIAVDFGFFINLNIGTPGTLFQLQIDTASADSWVASSTCDSCGKHPRLSADTSSSFKTSDTAWTSDYSSADLFSSIQTGTVSGTLCTDVLKFGGKALAGFQFGVANSVPEEFGADYVPYLGILGLGNSYVNPLMSLQGIPSPILTLYSSGVLPNAQVGIRLAAPGEIAFGGINNAQYSGQLALTKSVSKAGYWEADIEQISLIGSASPVSTRTGILDTRTALIYMPQGDVIALFNGITNAYFDLNIGLAIPCETKSAITFTIAGVEVTVAAKDLVFAPLTGDTAGICGVAACCLSTVQATSSNLGLEDTQLILGTPFLKQIYLGLDYYHSVIGIAPLN